MDPSIYGYIFKIPNMISEKKTFFHEFEFFFACKVKENIFNVWSNPFLRSCHLLEALRQCFCFHSNGCLYHGDKTNEIHGLFSGTSSHSTQWGYLIATKECIMQLQT